MRRSGKFGQTGVRKPGFSGCRRERADTLSGAGKRRKFVHAVFPPGALQARNLARTAATEYSGGAADEF
jgi:hypothetical protein